VPDLPGKGKRVVGIFVLMVGAGAILDDRAFWIGTGIMLVGAAAFIWGALETRRPAAAAAPAPQSPETVS